MQVIIYPQENGGVSIITPAPEYADQIEAVAAKDVPAGKPWRVMEDVELPPYDTRARWRWTDTGPLDVAPEVVAVPDEVSRFQARAGLIVYGQQIGRPRLLQEADAFVAGLTVGKFGLTVVDVELIREAWATAQVIRRDSLFLNALFPGLGLTLPEQLDAMFIVAAQQVA